LTIVYELHEQRIIVHDALFRDAAAAQSGRA
jgi:hypothetical protein